MTKPFGSPHRGPAGPKWRWPFPHTPAYSPYAPLTGMLLDGTTALGSLQLDSTLTPSHHWTCLDRAAPGGRAALDVDEDGYAALVRYGNGSAWSVAADTAPIDRE